MARRRGSGINSLKLNQDQGCFTCCMTNGLRVYNINPLVEKTNYSADEVGEVTLCELVLRSNWILLVRSLQPCTLLLLDDQTRKFRAQVQFKTPIRAIRAQKDKAAVVLLASVQVLALPSMQRLALLRTPQTPRPMCAMAVAPAPFAHYVAAPAPRQGSLQLWDISRIRGAHSSPPAVMACHQGALACLALAASGARLATASARGTVVRVWDTAAKALLHQMRRGSDYADIYCLSFTASGSVVSCVSDKGTLHVWDLAPRAAPPAHRAPAHAAPDSRAVCGFLDNTTTVVVATNGTFHKFTYSAEGTCFRTDFDYFLQVGDDDEFVE